MCIPYIEAYGSDCEYVVIDEMPGGGTSGRGAVRKYSNDLMAKFFCSDYALGEHREQPSQGAEHQN